MRNKIVFTVLVGFVAFAAQAGWLSYLTGTDKSVSKTEISATEMTNLASEELNFEKDAHNITVEEEFTQTDIEEDFVSIQRNEKIVTPRFAPMVDERDNYIVFNSHFLAMTPYLLDLADQAYLRSKNDRETIKTDLHKSKVGANPLWEIESFSAKRGGFFNDPHAGFVAFLKSDKDLLPTELQYEAGPVMVIAFHGSINNADWLTNYNGFKTKETELADEWKLDVKEFKGQAHRGFVAKYMSASAKILKIVDEWLQPTSDFDISKLKIYVTGHSQGAGLAQLATVHLATHLKKNHQHLMKDKNAHVNRINGWFLAAPATFEKDAKISAEETVGRHNMIRQNIRGDLVPNLAKPLGETLAGYKGIGVLVYQRGLTALKEAAHLNWEDVKRNFLNGELTYVKSELLSLRPVKILMAAPHFVSTRDDYRGQGFTRSLVKIGSWELAANAYEGAANPGKSYFRRIFGY